MGSGPKEVAASPTYRRGNEHRRGCSPSAQCHGPEKRVAWSHGHDDGNGDQRGAAVIAKGGFGAGAKIATTSAIDQKLN